MMELRYIKTDPTKNITLLVETPVAEAEQSAAAEKLMQLMPDCEQVGFVGAADGCDAALRMMGGEFCGNASLSLAAVLAEKCGREGNFTLRVSGAEKPVKVNITQAIYGYAGSVAMPLPLKTERMRLGRYAPQVVRFPGIAHAVVTERMPVALAEMVIREWNAAVCADALGIMLFNESAGELTPVVYVRSTDTVVCEGSCASGTAAAAVIAALRDGTADISLREPGGIMGARAVAANGSVTELSLTGRVAILEKGVVTVS